MADPLAARAAAFAALGAEPFDLLIVGGGINGAGIARDAVMRGLRVAVVEQGDFGSGTSSRSSKLIHGGLRYLEQGHVGLVLESVRERERLRRLARHLVRPQRFFVPVYEDGPVGFWKLSAGLWAYDLLAGWWNVHRHRMLSASAARDAEPALRSEGLRGAGVYWDCRTDDARLVLETLLSAAREGAVALSYCRVTAFEKEAGRIVGARVLDRLGGAQTVARAKVVVNAAGPWVDTVAALDGPGPGHLRLTKGVHIVVPRAPIGHRDAMVLNAVRDGRVMFVIPWGEHSLVGTTDTDHHGGPDTPPVAEPDDVAYLLETVNHYFPRAQLGPGDVVSAFAGLRPLVAPAPGTTLDPSETSREEEILVSASGLVSIAGGKLTTHRLIAAKVVDRVAKVLRQSGDPRRIGRSRTGKHPLPGGTADPAALAASAISRDGHGLPPAVVGHLAERYGSRLDEVLGHVGRDPALGAPIVPTLPDPRAEVVTAVEDEWALTLEDVLRRRTRVALCDEANGKAAAASVADLMAEPLGWTPEAAHAAADAYTSTVDADRRRWR
jgi:glycerol-3-phosphate dehydrogenase